MYEHWKINVSSVHSRSAVLKSVTEFFNAVSDRFEKVGASKEDVQVGPTASSGSNRDKQNMEYENI